MPVSNHRPRKHFGQNFLHDRNIIDKILRAIDPRDDQHFVEIGPGRGALTQPLLDQVKQLDVIEIDRDLAANLSNDINSPKFRLHVGDALKFDFATLTTLPGALRLVGNLPYNISTPLLFHFLDYASLFTDAHVMLQKEVVDRMTAPPGNRTYGRLTVSLAARCQVDALFVVKPGSFTPAPRVDSTIARLTPDPVRRAQLNDPAAFDKVVAQAFNQRRKRLANALRPLLTEAQIAALDIDPGVRAERLNIDEFIRLGNALAAHQNVRPNNPADED
jgi:16S rRNA (adenine1518-N6/adenine1519-N6)-dimethyltransferase